MQDHSTGHKEEPNVIHPSYLTELGGHHVQRSSATFPTGPEDVSISVPPVRDKISGARFQRAHKKFPMQCPMFAMPMQRVPMKTAEEVPVPDSFPPSHPAKQLATVADSFALSHDHTLAAGGRLIRILRLLDLSDEQLKGLFDVFVVARAGLGPAAAVLLRQLLAVLSCDLALLGAQVTLVAHDDDRNPLDAL